YGCSKGSADQYVCDYARSFGVRAVVFRMSCIYGPRQFGTEDQGWVAHFLIRALRGEPITLYGDGLQVRDILYVRDLLDAMEMARANVDRLAGRAFNIGGGPANTLSLMELVDRIGELTGRRPDVVFNGWRTGDQRYYVSDTRAFRRETAWSPRVGSSEGIASLHRWLVENAGRPLPSGEPTVAEAR
ncbi:MAG TPA: NAD-dependent epimerase/dehydratase family protein, partial [Polyangiaceae bacterium]|nr:NAD-dependent epimerase/dehydratase family protein [Polyangiaceae bacterium]